MKTHFEANRAKRFQLFKYSPWFLLAVCACGLTDHRKARFDRQ